MTSGTSDEFPKQFIELFGISIYQVKLELAVGFYLRGMSLSDAWLKANEFIAFTEKYYKPKD